VSAWGIADVARAVAAPGRRLELAGHGRAAVLVPILETAGGLELLFTVRAAGLTRHAGQVAFPGGRLEPGEDVVAAALREAEEEVGLAVAPDAVLGILDDRPSPFGLVATPVVARVAWPAPLRLDPGEVAGTFTLPLAALAAIRPTVEERLHEGVVRQLYRYRVGAHEVWGLTGNVVRDLLDRLAAREAAA
jgi:8-oxo-dGTP pyrophosphatase MutT (NUDIX family)